jgi:hypothetical protein
MLKLRLIYIYRHTHTHTEVKSCHKNSRSMHSLYCYSLYFEFEQCIDIFAFQKENQNELR